MKVQSSFKTLGLITVATLALGGGLAQASATVAYVHYDAGNPYLAGHHGGRGHHERHDRDGDGPYSSGMHQHGSLYWQLERRQDRQMDRIERGMSRGEITRREAAKLFLEQREIERMQRHFLADGHLSRREYAALDEALDRAGQHIRHQANDNEWRW